MEYEENIFTFIGWRIIFGEDFRFLLLLMNWSGKQGKVDESMNSQPAIDAGHQHFADVMSGASGCATSSFLLLMASIRPGQDYLMTGFSVPICFVRIPQLLSCTHITFSPHIMVVRNLFPSPSRCRMGQIIPTFLKKYSFSPYLILHPQRQYIFLYPLQFI
jgi:hypothetical protein